MPKLNVQFDSKVNKLLQELADQKGTTKTEIILRALATYKSLNDETSDGDKRVSVTSAKENRILKNIILP
jgi:predicted transcriptional regulator